MTADPAASAEPQLTIIEPQRGMERLKLSDLWLNRELIAMLAKRTILQRYKQTTLGPLWALVQPLAYMLVLNTFFSLVIRAPTPGVPYPLHLLTGIVAFQFFTKCLNDGASSIGRNSGILSKVYLPRVIFPVVSIIVTMFDFLFPFTLLVVFLAIYGVAPTANLLALPVIFFFLLLGGMAASLIMSVSNVRFQDMRVILPIMTQMLFFATPIFYSASIIPESWQWLYGLNPLVGIVESFRWCMLGLPEPPPLHLLASSAITILVMFVVSLYYFRWLDRSIYQYL